MSDDLTTLRDQLKANPHDFHLMAVYADLLDEQEPCYVVCKCCSGGKTHSQVGGLTFPCGVCDGTGQVLDPTNALLAEGYRALALVRPVYDREQNCWWGWQSHMPMEWYDRLRHTGKGKSTDSGIQFDDTLKALDAAALAWAGLPAETKERIRTTGPWAEKGGAA